MNYLAAYTWGGINNYKNCENCPFKRVKCINGLSGEWRTEMIGTELGEKYSLKSGICTKWESFKHVAFKKIL